MISSNRKLSRFLLIAAFLTLLRPGTAAPALTTQGAVPHWESKQPRTLTTQFFYTATVPNVPVGASALDVWLPIPSNSVWQTVTDLHVTSPVPFRVTQERRYGNRMVFLHVGKPAGALTVVVQFTVARREVRVLNLPQEEGAAGLTTMPTSAGALSPDRRVPVGGRFKTIATQVTRGQTTPLRKERVLFDSVVSGMHYDYKKMSPEYGQGDAAFVCDYKSGNCSDLHSYLIALSRSIGTPAILEFGFPLTSIPLAAPLPTEGTISGYHCWAWFHAPAQGWIPMDAADARRWQDAGDSAATNFLFGNLVLERSAVAMSRGRDLTLEPAQKGDPINEFIYPYAEADGAAVDASWTLRYHLLSQAP